MIENALTLIPAKHAQFKIGKMRKNDKNELFHFNVTVCFIVAATVLEDKSERKSLKHQRFVRKRLVHVLTLKFSPEI